MRLKHRALQLWMELRRYVECVLRDFNNLHQITIWIKSRRNHSIFLEIFKILIIKFITMTMSLLNILFPIYAIGESIFLYLTRISTQTHSPTHTCNMLLAFHQVYNFMGCLWCYFSRVSILVTQYIAGEFNHSTLHS